MNRPAGFTLVSFILVVAIIGAITAILLPAAANVGSAAKVKKTKADLRNIKNALEFYCLTYGVYPDLKQNEWEDPDQNVLLHMERRLIDYLPEDPYNPGNGYQYELYLGKDWTEPVYAVYTKGPQGNGSVQFKQKEPDRVTIRNGATTAFITNARDVVLEP